MLTNELLNELHQLNRSEKLRVVQRLVNELADEGESILSPTAEYQFWSAYDSADVAAQLMRELEDDEKPHNG